MRSDPAVRKAPERVDTARLLIRRPRLRDAPEIFRRYAADPEATRYLSWPVHASLEQTRAFVAFSDSEWRRWPAGPYLVFLRDGLLIGGTGLSFESADRAQTGYVLAPDAWGQGYATEALLAMVDVARATGVRLLYALCHVDHRASARVLEKGGFVCEAVLPRFVEFPNLSAGVKSDVLKYVRRL
jgi:ribosomal-protein-alanine N-acetyltransferase